MKINFSEWETYQLFRRSLLAEISCVLKTEAGDQTSSTSVPFIFGARIIGFQCEAKIKTGEERKE